MSWCDLELAVMTLSLKYIVWAISLETVRYRKLTLGRDIG